MNFDLPRQYFESTLQSGWTETPIAFDNVPFDSGNNAFIRVTIQEGDSKQVTMGDAPQLHRGVGVTFIQLFTPAGTGTARARQYATTLASMFRSKSWAQDQATITTQSPTIKRLGEDKFGWYQINVIIPFIFENYC